MGIFGISSILSSIKNNAQKKANEKKAELLKRQERFKPDEFVPAKGSVVVSSGPDKYGRYVESYDNGVTVINQKNGGKIYEEWSGKKRHLVVVDSDNTVIRVVDNNRKIIYCKDGSQIEILSEKNKNGDYIDNFVTLYTSKYPNGVSLKTQAIKDNKKISFITNFETGEMRVCATYPDGTLEITSIDNFLKANGGLDQTSFEPVQYPAVLLSALMKGIV